MEFNLETVLAVVISLITLNLIFIGFYIISVLREIKKAVGRASKVIDEVDYTVKDGIEKAKAMEKPLAALAGAGAALSGVIKGAEAIRRATSSITGNNDASEGDDDAPSPETDEPKKRKRGDFLRRPKFFKKKG